MAGADVNETAASAGTESDPVLVRVEQLSVHFALPSKTILPSTRTVVRAVDNISLSIVRGETLGLVGESGCGKSTAGRAIIRLYRPTSGRVVYNGIDLESLTPDEVRRMRRHFQMIFQDPFASLNPRKTVARIIAEPLEIHNLMAKSLRDDRIFELMQLVGLDPKYAKRYPHEFSGGQRQRIGIARALAAEPDFVVADEPVSALDVSIQAQIVNLMEELQERLGLTYLFIAHDLSVVKHMANRVAVMYLGKIVEIAGGKELYRRPLHPYTQALLSAVPVPDPEVEKTRERIVLTGDVPSPSSPPRGCVFHTRCRHVMQVCREVEPQLQDRGSGQKVACHLYG